MQKRKIITIALLSASAGCGASSSRSAAPAPQPGRLPVPEVAAAPPTSTTTPIAGVELVGLPAAAPPYVAPIPAADAAQPRERLELRNELYQAGNHDRAIGEARFRALCDEHGYPLVGNVSGKSMRYDVSAYCTDVRTEILAKNGA